MKTSPVTASYCKVVLPETNRDNAEKPKTTLRTGYLRPITAAEARAIDTNGDGKITKEEIDVYNKKNHEAGKTLWSELKTKLKPQRFPSVQTLTPEKIAGRRKAMEETIGRIKIHELLKNAYEYLKQAEAKKTSGKVFHTGYLVPAKTETSKIDLKF